MSLVTPEVHAPLEGLSAEHMLKLEELAQKHGWTLDNALRHAVDITEIVMDAKDDPDSNVYVYRGGRRYALEVEG